MSTKTKKLGIIEILKNMFSSEPDIEDYESVTLPKELADVRKSLEVKENKIQQGFNTGTKGGIAPKINPNTEKAMRAMHSKVAKKEQKTSDREIGE